MDLLQETKTCVLLGSRVLNCRKSLEHWSSKGSCSQVCIAVLVCWQIHVVPFP